MQVALGVAGALVAPQYSGYLIAAGAVLKLIDLRRQHKSMYDEEEHEEERLTLEASSSANGSRDDGEMTPSTKKPNEGVTLVWDDLCVVLTQPKAKGAKKPPTIGGRTSSTTEKKKRRGIPIIGALFSILGGIVRGGSKKKPETTAKEPVLPAVNIDKEEPRTLTRSISCPDPKFQLARQGRVTPDIPSFETTNQNKETKLLLNNARGIARPGRILAIMGPSGAGKSTLLDTLAGRIPAQKNIEIQGTILANGEYPGSGSHRNQAYLVQDPVFFSQLTVYETLLFAAQTSVVLKEHNEFKLNEIIHDLIKKLGLVTCSDTKIGEPDARGISGGERKRVALACELLGAPKLVFADEPTTGLDSFQAERVMKTLRQLADEGHTVITSLHQPNERIYEMLDDLILMAEGGEMVYYGEAKHAAGEYFKKLGYETPPHVSYPDHFLEIITIDRSSQKAEATCRERLVKLRSTFKVARANIDIASASKRPAGGFRHSSLHLNRKNGIPLFKQLALLFVRSWRQVRRNRKFFLQRMIPAVMSGLTFGWIYWQLGLAQSTILDRMGLVQVCCINSAMLSLVRTLYVFPIEKQVVHRERGKSAYGLLPYLVSKLAADLPTGAIFPMTFSTIVYTMSGLQRSLTKYLTFMGVIVLESFSAGAMGLAVGAIANSVQTAVSIGPNAMTLFVVFSGYYVNASNVPWLLRWIPDVSMIRWAFEGIAINEFRGLVFESELESDCQTGEQALERLSFGNESVGRAIRNQLRILGVFYCLTYTLLILKEPKFSEPKLIIQPSHPTVQTPSKGAMTPKKNVTIEDVTLEEELDLERVESDIQNSVVI